MHGNEIDAQAMFEDRATQFEKFGIPAEDIERVRGAVGDMWADAPGGCVYEWSALAAGYARAGEHYLASLAYGCAKFPCLADEPRARALQHQLSEFLAAATTSPVRFERRVVPVDLPDGTVEMPVHLYSCSHDYSRAPVLMASGGVDIWKMDIHPWWVAFAMNAGVSVLPDDDQLGEGTIRARCSGAHPDASPGPSASEAGRRTAALSLNEPCSVDMM